MPSPTPSDLCGRQNGCFLATLESDSSCCKPIPTQSEIVVVIY